MTHPSQLPITDFIRDCRFRRQRRSGPGGQHRNKVETGIFAQHVPTGICAEATEERSQAHNQAIAIERLRIRVAVEHRVACELLAEPSALWRSRCRGGKIAVSRQHADFAAMLSEALDVVFVCNVDLAAAARQLGCTRSQLTRFFAAERTALALVNTWRGDRGQPPLRTG